ncbi:hypothetical protein ACLB1S_29570 [Escherichia coli]
MENPRTFFRHELRLQSVFIKLAWASSAGIISLLFIFVAYQPGVENQAASSLGGITAMETVAACAIPPAAGRGDPLLQTQ